MVGDADVGAGVEVQAGWNRNSNPGAFDVRERTDDREGAIMSNFFEGIAAVAQEIARERGPFTLFAIMHRPDTPDWWNVVVSAPWLDPEGLADYRYLTEKFKGFSRWDKMPRISHVSILRGNDPIVLDLVASRELEPGRICPMIEPVGPIDFDKGYLVERRQPAVTTSNGRNGRRRPAKAHKRARAGQHSSS